MSPCHCLSFAPFTFFSLIFLKHIFLFHIPMPFLKLLFCPENAWTALIFYPTKFPHASRSNSKLFKKFSFIYPPVTLDLSFFYSNEHIVLYSFVHMCIFITGLCSFGGWDCIVFILNPQCVVLCLEYNMHSIKSDYKWINKQMYA